MLYQIDCFNTHLKFFKYLAIWCRKSDQFPFYKIYSRIFVFLFLLFHSFLFTINFIFIEKHLDNVIEEMLLWLTVMSVVSKAYTFILLHDDIQKILVMLESDIFQPRNDIGVNLLTKAKKTNVTMWKIFAVSSLSSHLSHACPPLILHFALGHELLPPMCSYAFLTHEERGKFIYLICFFQIVSIQTAMWYNVNIDSFFLGLLNLIIAQLDILSYKLKAITDVEISKEIDEDLEDIIFMKLKDCILHYTSIYDFCFLVQNTFSVTLFIQFNIASFVICVCLFRLNLPITPAYLVFLLPYLLIMVVQILFPCWFGHQIFDKSTQLSSAVYTCGWPSRPRRFISSLRVFMCLLSRPVSITGGKIFPLLLITFSSIANSSYSFYTLLRNLDMKEYS